MSLTLTLGPLWVFDEGDGPGRAEPYIWPVFYKVDEEAVDWIVDPEREARPEPPWFIAPGGSHDNLPRADAGNRFEVVRTHTFPTFTPLALTPGESAIGFVVVLLEEDDVPSDSQINRSYRLFASAVREKVIEAINEGIASLFGGGGGGGGSSTGEGIAELLRTKFESEVWRELMLHLGIGGPLPFIVRAFVNRDDVIGAWSRVIKLADLPAPGSFRRYGPVMWSSRNGSEDGRYGLQARIDRTA